jgi:hypothetical protein
MTSIDASTMSRLVEPARRGGPRDAQPLGEKQPRGRGRTEPERPGLVQRLIPIAKKLERTASAGLPPRIWRWSSARLAGCTTISSAGAERFRGRALRRAIWPGLRLR